MKFTNGFWVVKPEFTPDWVRDIYEVEQFNQGLRCYAPYRKIVGRGDVLNIGLMTMTFTAPAQDVLKIKLQNHIGNYVTTPQFSVTEEETMKPLIEKEDETYRITSGRLSLELTCGNPGLTFKADGKHLTYVPEKATSMMHHKEGKHYLVTGLNLNVGELVYGLGERFTPFVKNGQNIDIWNEDGGTASEISYKNIPFYMTSKGYGVFVNHPGKVSFEVASEKVETVQFSVEDEELEYYLIYGPEPKEIIRKYTALTGRSPVPPKWSFGLWLTTSFTTDYNEATVNHFIDEMEKREIPLHVFHFDCFWMKGFEWCNFQWDKEMFPDPEGMLKRLHERGLKVCVWINPYIAQKSPLFKEAMDAGYLLMKENGRVWQWDMWQAGMGLVDFTNPAAWSWFQEKLKALLTMGVDCFKTDFGERIPVDVTYFDYSDPVKMHNYYAYLYNSCVFELLQREKGDDAVVFARSATAGGQKFPVHWGGDSTSQFISMAESLRGGLSLMDSGFAFWSHDIGGFEDNGCASLYKRWVAFGMLSSHSRLHGSGYYRVPWNYDEEACEVLKYFTKLKCRLMPYLYQTSVQAHLTGIPVMRPMHIEYPEDKNCSYLDNQYMLGDSLLVAPVFSEDGVTEYYLPEGRWTHLISGKTAEGGRWYTEQYDYFSLPLFVKEGTILPMGSCDTRPDYDYTDQTEYRIYGVKTTTSCELTKESGKKRVTVTVKQENGKLTLRTDGQDHCSFLLVNVNSIIQAEGCSYETVPEGILVKPEKNIDCILTLEL